MKRILIKMSGEVFKTNNHSFALESINSIITQIKQLQKTHHVSLLVGGGNFFRGEQHGKKLGLELATGHTIGMIATMMNGVILQELMKKADIDTVQINAFSCPAIAQTLNKEAIENAILQNQCIIFTGGTGNPYFTTDTAAVIRSLQVGADELWKATKVDGIYDKDPAKHKDAKRYKQLTYDDVIEQKLQIMDLTAITLARKHAVRIRIFDIFARNALLDTATHSDYASLISE